MLIGRMALPSFLAPAERLFDCRNHPTNSAFFYPSFPNSMSTDGEKSGNITIGEGVTVTGTLSVPGKATINGWIQGELTADELTVGTEGKVVGKVTVRIADIHGSTHDSIAATEQLTIRTTGQVHGTATYGRIEIARGGMMVGKVGPFDPAADAASPKAPDLPSGLLDLAGSITAAPGLVIVRSA